MYILINSMEQSTFWEKENYPGRQEISRLLWKPNIHVRVPESPSLDSLLSQLNPTHILTPYFSYNLFV
jgi:hypothetical protein